VTIVRPPRLRRGDRVAVAAPSGVVDPGRLADGMAELERWGLEPVPGAHVLDCHGHLAGTDEDRVADLNAAFRDPTVRAIWTARGGFGLTRILDRLDWSALAADPKLLIGFSDVTALLVAAWRRLGLVTVHGQFASRLHLVAPHTTAADHLRALVFGTGPGGAAPALPHQPAPVTIAPGTATGPLVGGNLAVLCALLGTPDQLDVDGCVLLLEDVNERPYRIDRMLTQLRAAGVLQRVAGLAVGTFVDCDAAAHVPSATTADVVAERLGDLGVPVLAGLPVGHHDDQLAVAHGAAVRLDAGAGTLEFLEPAVV
jgi:muramoyltetrapeptide carboxypeptidase